MVIISNQMCGDGELGLSQNVRGGGAGEKGIDVTIEDIIGRAS